MDGSSKEAVAPEDGVQPMSRKARRLQHMQHMETVAPEGAPQSTPIEAQPPAPGPQPTETERGQLLRLGNRALRRRQREFPVPVPVEEPAPLSRPEPVRRKADEPRAQPQPRRHVKRSSRIALVCAALVLIALPTLAASIYYGFFAANQYIATAQFAIRSQSMTSSSMDPTSMLMGSPTAAGLPVIADTFIVSDYIQSSQILKDIADKVDIRRIYSHEGADWLYRLDPTISDEALLKFWQSVAEVHFDITTSISTLTVRAFTPEDAQKVADTVLSAGEALVNLMSDRAQADTVKLAQSEVATAKGQLNDALDALKIFQQREQQIDPLALAKTRSTIEGLLEGKVAEFQAQLSTLRSSLPDTAPTVRLLKSQIRSMQDQLAVEQAKSTTGSGVPTATVLMSDFDKLNVDREVAEKAYASALSSLVLARQEAIRQNRYLVAFVRPQRPDDTLFPNRPYMILLVAIAGALAWFFVALIFSVVREHL